MVNRCAATTVSGSPCSAQPVRDDGYCYWHSPALKAERDAARRRGGSARSNRSRARKATAGMDREDIDVLLGAVLKGVLVERFTPGQATAAATVAKAMMAVREAGAIEALTARLDELEAMARRGGVA